MRYALLTIADVRAIFRIVGALREIGGPPAHWAPHLFEAVDRAIGAPVANRFEAPGRFAPVAELVGLLAWNFDGPLARTWSRYWSTGGPERDPSWPPAVHRSGASFTCARRMMVADRVWYRSEHVREERHAAGVDDFVVSHRWVPGMRWAHAAVFFRAKGERRFSARHVQWIELLHEELGQLWSPRRDRRLTLPQRAAQTFDGLVMGESEKQIADRMGISAHSVHDHVKTVYRHFGVNSRAQLVATWVRDTRLRRPRLDGERDPRFVARGPGARPPRRS